MFSLNFEIEAFGEHKWYRCIEFFSAIDCSGWLMETRHTHFKSTTLLISFSLKFRESLNYFWNRQAGAKPFVYRISSLDSAVSTESVVQTIRLGVRANRDRIRVLCTKFWRKVFSTFKEVLSIERGSQVESVSRQDFALLNASRLHCKALRTHKKLAN